MQPTATQARRQQLKEAEEIRVNEEGIVALRRRKSNAKFRARKKAELKKLQEDLKQKHEIDKQRNQQHQDEEKGISNEKRMNLEDVEHYSAIRSVSYSQPSKDNSMIPNSSLQPNLMPRPRIDGSSLSQEQSQSGDEYHDTEHENKYISAVSNYTQPSGPPERTVYRIMTVGNSRTHCDPSSGKTANLPRSLSSQRTGSLPQHSPTPGATARNRADHEDIDARSAFDGTGEGRDEGEIDENDCRSAAEWAEAAREVEERCSGIEERLEAVWRQASGSSAELGSMGGRLERLERIEGEATPKEVKRSKELAEVVVALHHVNRELQEARSAARHQKQTIGALVAEGQSTQESAEHLQSRVRQVGGLAVGRGTMLRGLLTALLRALTGR